MIKFKIRPDISFNHLGVDLLLILLLGLSLRLVNLNQSLWLDEAAQAIESAGPFEGLFAIYADFMPPLFHILLHFWMKISQSEVWMRLLSVFFGLGTIVYTYTIAKELFSKKVGLLSAFFLAVSQFHIFYSQELRPYALACLLGSAATYYLIKRQFFPYTVIATLFIYSLYTAAFLFFSHGVYIFMRKKKYLRSWIIAILVSLVTFLPWLPVFTRQLEGGSRLMQQLPGWSTAVSSTPLKALPLTFAKFLLGRITIDDKVLYGSIFFFLMSTVSVLLFTTWRKHQKTVETLLFFLFVPLMSAFLVSFFLPVIAPQRVLFTLPFFLILLASGIYELRRGWSIAALTILLLANTYGLMQYYTNSRFQREQWRQATSFVEQRVDKQVGVMFAFPEPFAPFIWYRRNPSLGEGVAKNFVVNEEDLQHISQYIEDKNKVFFFQYLTDLTDPNRRIPSLLVNKGYSHVTTYDFAGVGFVYHYERL